MPNVEVERVIAAPRNKVYKLAKNMEAFQQHMPNAREIKTHERSETDQLTEWITQLKGMTFRWVERETFDDDAMTIHYKQTEGDLKKMEGDWTFTEQNGQTRVAMTCHFEFGMPALAVILNPVGTLAVKDNLNKMLAALDQMATEAAATS